ncbi:MULTISPECIES: hypothetical protein [Flavobacteriaceae]|uniref:hypothetical protein n=1 Tax=Flavobacteriaceae TaxID=49546 RepID=UPI00234B56BE|nr:hypothetical protein [Muricauda sp. SP22]MDC6364117.1 hypothetical protein [Muricauda sp. SP22]
MVHIPTALVEGAGQLQHVALMGPLGVGHGELEGEGKHHIVQHRYLGHALLWGFLEDQMALRPMHLLQQLPVLVVLDFQAGKGKVQGGSGVLVEKAVKGG